MLAGTSRVSRMNAATGPITTGTRGTVSAMRTTRSNRRPTALPASRRIAQTITATTTVMVSETKFPLLNHIALYRCNNVARNIYNTTNKAGSYSSNSISRPRRSLRALWLELRRRRPRQLLHRRKQHQHQQSGDHHHYPRDHQHGLAIRKPGHFDLLAYYGHHDRARFSYRYGWR